MFSFRRGRFPALSLLCEDLIKSTQQLPFLCASTVISTTDTNLCFEASAYLNHIKSGKLGSRHFLTKREEARVIGTQSRVTRLPPRFIPDQKLPPCPVTAGEIQYLQSRLDELGPGGIRRSKMRDTDNTFPLKDAQSSKLEADMVNELKESWEAHQNLRPVNRQVDSKDLLPEFDLMYKKTLKFRHDAEKYVLDALNRRPQDCSHWHSQAHEVLQLSGLVPSATVEDLAKIAVNPSLINEFNPMLGEQSRKELVTSIITWLQLCVNEDKLERMILLCKRKGADDEVMKELETKSVWNAHEHPFWLVFEVENGITIRQEQYHVAQHLIDNPGDVIQLNMGAGKVSLCQPFMLESYASTNSDNAIAMLDKGHPTNASDVLVLQKERKGHASSLSFSSLRRSLPLSTKSLDSIYPVHQNLHDALLS